MNESYVYWRFICGGFIAISHQHSHMDMQTPPIALTDPSDRVVRDADALDGIDSRLIATAEFRLLTPYVGRILRREYNWTARKMYLRGRSDDHFRKRAICLIDEFAAEITMLADDIDHLDRWTSFAMNEQEFSVKVVGMESARLLRQLRRLDAVAAVLYRAQIAGNALSTKERWEYLTPVSQAMSRITNHCLGATDEKTLEMSATQLRLGD
jgi:hypothetical protein